MIEHKQIENEVASRVCGRDSISKVQKENVNNLVRGLLEHGSYIKELAFHCYVNGNSQEEVVPDTLEHECHQNPEWLNKVEQVWSCFNDDFELAFYRNCWTELDALGIENDLERSEQHTIEKSFLSIWELVRKFNKWLSSPIGLRSETPQKLLPVRSAAIQLRIHAINVRNAVLSTGSNSNTAEKLTLDLEACQLVGQSNLDLLSQLALKYQEKFEWYQAQIRSRMVQLSNVEHCRLIKSSWLSYPSFVKRSQLKLPYPNGQFFDNCISEVTKLSESQIIDAGMFPRRDGQLTIESKRELVSRIRFIALEIGNCIPGGRGIRWLLAPILKAFPDSSLPRLTQWYNEENSKKNKQLVKPLASLSQLLGRLWNAEQYNDTAKRLNEICDHIQESLNRDVPVSEQPHENHPEPEKNDWKYGFSTTELSKILGVTPRAIQRYCKAADAYVRRYGHGKYALNLSDKEAKQKYLDWKSDLK